MTTITAIQSELTHAEASYSTALRELVQASTTFNEGAGKTYAKLVQRHAELRGKIAMHEAAAEAATLEFKSLLAASGYEKTKPVK